MTSRSMLRAGRFLALALVLAGCEGKDAASTVHVRGTVTCDGHLIPLGLIVFEPDPSQGNSGPQGHADIKNGEFDTRLSKKAAVVGPLLVRITGGDGVNPEPFTPFGKRLFDEYTTRIELSKEQTTLQFDVPRPQSKRGP